MTNLKQLYQEYVTDIFENGKPDPDNLKGWYQGYNDLYNEVAKMRSQLQNRPLCPKNDRAFLERIIYEDSNYISAKGRSDLTKPDFEKLIGEPDFLKAIENLIKYPNADNVAAFAAVWKRFKEKYNMKIVNHLRIYRVASASTNEVSTTVSEDIFKEVFKKLESKGLVKKQTFPRGTSRYHRWYKKNQHIMEVLRKEFKTELANKETDLFKLSIFVWELCRNNNDWS